MPQAAIGIGLGGLGKLAGGLGLGALGALGGAKEKSAPTTINSTSTTLEDLFQEQQSQFEQESQQDQYGFEQAIEDSQMAEFRKSLAPLFQQELRRAQTPVYGEAQKASLLNSLNDLADASTSKLKNSLAASGALDSGAAASGEADILSGRNAQAAQFFSQLPFLEEQRRAGATAGLLGQATNWAGRAPTSVFRAGSAFGSGSGGQTATSTSTGKKVNTGQQTQQGPGFGSNLAGGLGGLATGLAGKLLGGIFK